ncbi:MAG: DNA topoisomerase 4 subunit A [Clostridia bacterium]|nr:DNA topoisomerase 4 subunit A [Clostridia bacterium]
MSNENEELKTTENAENSDRMYEKTVEQVLHESMIPYSEYVILDRALPRVEDGLKPVQRRILYSMYELGITHDKPHKKCARIVGECLGKYHPHGDSSVYDALVRLAQSFNMSEPLVDGHGNFGSVDGDSAAAMRYTEARLAPIAQEMLRDLDKDTVTYSLNFDDTLKEPDMLPGRFPNLLVNGASGIAVGLATNIPTHNLSEVIDGAVAMIENPHIKLDDLMNIIKGPDFPTGGILFKGEELRQAYETGKGKVTIAAKMHIEREGDKKSIVITELPYQVNKSKLLQKINELRETKKEPYVQIADILDESDRQGLRATIKLKRDADADRIVKLLLKHTDLQTNFGINMVVIADGKPRLMGLREILKYYLDYQRNLIQRRTRFDLNAAKERDEILRGLLVAIQNIDEVIAIIKGAKNVTEAKDNLRQRFTLSEKQANAIVEMKLRRLTNLETDEIITEIEELRKKIEYLTRVLGSVRMQYSVVKEELLDIKKRYKRVRRTEIIGEGDKEYNVSELKPEEAAAKPVVNGGVVLFGNGNLKFCNQRTLGAAGKNILGLSDADMVKDICYLTSDKNVYCFTDKGNVARISAADLPEKSWKDRGLPFVKVMSQGDKEERVVSVLCLDDVTDPQASVVFFTSDGMAKRTLVSEYLTLTKNYFQATIVKEGERVVNVMPFVEGYSMIFVTQDGMVLKAETDDVPVQGRRSAGVKGIMLSDGDAVSSANVVDDAGEVIVLTELGYGKRVLISEIDPSKRYRKGLKLIDTDLSRGKVVFSDVVKMPYLVALFYDNEENELINTDLFDLEDRTDIGVYLPADRNVRIVGAWKHRTN